MKTVILALAAAGMLAFPTLGATTKEISTSFATDPAQQGWKTYGDSSLFRWDSTNGSLEVTWDSSKPNSYFYYPLGTTLTRKDDFKMEFDLTIHDLTNDFELAMGFMNWSNATSTNFLRGTGSDSPNLAEFDYFPPGDWDGGVAPTFSATNNFQQGGFNSSLSSGWFNSTLPMETPLHVVITYTGTNSTATTTVSTPTATLVSGPFTLPAEFTDFNCDTFAVESYNDTGAWGMTVLAHASLSNLKITFPVPPLTNITGQMLPAGWTISFNTVTGWNYVLERSSDLSAWTTVGSTNGTGSACSLQDTDKTPKAQFYRVRAQQTN